jgi:hypothetical protein
VHGVPRREKLQLARPAEVTFPPGCTVQVAAAGDGRPALIARIAGPASATAAMRTRMRAS